MKIFIMRHGDAAPGYPDETRELTETGRREAANVGKFLARHPQFLPKRIVSSELTRARQTVDLVLEHQGMGLKSEPMAGLTPMDSLEPLIKWFNQSKEDAFIVGHLPYVDSLVAFLTAGNMQTDIVKFPTGTLVCLQSQMRYASRGSAQVKWMLSPKLIAPFVAE